MTRKTLIDDMERIEDATCDLKMERRYSVAVILYWLCVAVLHIIEWEVQHYDHRARN